MNHRDGKPSVFQALGLLIEEQYEVTEMYCNCQTALRNLVVGLQQSTGQRLQNHRVLVEYLEARGRVQTNFSTIEEYCQDTSCLLTDTDKKCGSTLMDADILREVLIEHCTRSRRVIQTIHLEGGGDIYPNGLPVPGNESVTSTVESSLLVALSTLRASIKRVQDLLPDDTPRKAQMVA